MIEWEKQFPIASINRADLTEFGFTDEYIAREFTDEVMTEIAESMEESFYLNYRFWDDFRRAICKVLREQDVQRRPDLKQKKFRERKELTRGDSARISASAVNAVLEKLDIRQIVEGIAVLPAGEEVYLVDIVMRDLAGDSTWSISITVPPPREASEE